ncbi:MAG: DNA mismatch repair protein MutS [Brumimicrobium sp.]|nr:DNA mismatch repair protein MutS [Brumimicrobium sp.]
MLYCDDQTYKDLEFDVIQSLLEGYCVSSGAKDIVLNIKPVSDKRSLKRYLLQADELLRIRSEGLPFPRIEFRELHAEIRLLGIKNSSLPVDGFLKIFQASTLVNDLIYFFNKCEEDYPQLNSLLSNVYYTKDITAAIERIIDTKGKVRDDASPELYSIRTELKSLEKQSNIAFDREMKKWVRKGYLSDTREAFFDERRYLAVISSYKRQIGGHISGSSKSGGVTYIEPEATIPINNEIDRLKDDERNEIIIILRKLTEELKSHLPLITEYQKLLVKFDFINAKTRLAIETGGFLPAISEAQGMDLIDAYHPVLRISNQRNGKKTVPQHITMDASKRILVISGPNAGGKSITLKTVGLLQLMLQCGLLVPVNPNSKMCFFKALLTDIGDNQSIENELSTYSYRLKRMKQFLDLANKNSLLLLDEFGTGSDPDLGGALAEVFFEQIYAKGSFGVITTHYGNIKLKADELANAVNGCMLFDTDTLSPLFKLSVGQPGSSFTFEVAQINGIPMELIRDAKSRLDGKKVKMDRLLNELQKEKSYLSKLNKEHIKAQQLAEEARIEFERYKAGYEDKLKQLRDRAGESGKLIILGKKMQSFIDKFKTRGKGKNLNADLLDEVKKYITVEKSKLEEIKNEERLKKESKKKKNKKPSQITVQYNQDKIKVGSSVKLIATKQKGLVEEIEGKEVTVTFGFVRMKVGLNLLMWVSD